MANLPEINFLTTDAMEIVNETVAIYEELEDRKLAEADPLRLIFMTLASVITKQNVKINHAAKQNLLYYAEDGVLDHKGDEWRTPRLKTQAATTTLRLHLSVQLTTSRILPKGSLATSNEAAIFFATKEDSVINMNVDYVDVELECTVKGTVGNGFLPGQINTLVQPLPYISHVENITESSGGAEEENNDPYRERIRLAPESISNAGSEGAYAYFAKSASALISDVYVHKPSPGCVDITVLLQNGELPTQEILDAVLEKCSEKTVRPLTDYVTASIPGLNEYDLEVEYFIGEDATSNPLVHQNIAKAIDEFVIWQQSKIARNINPTKLHTDCREAGAKRIVTNLRDTVIPAGTVAQIRNKTVVFGGVESD